LGREGCIDGFDEFGCGLIVVNAALRSVLNTTYEKIEDASKAVGECIAGKSIFDEAF
jgi:hypothetical protein